MKFEIQSPKKAISSNKGFVKYRPVKSEIELFKKNLNILISKIDEIEREENQKNHVRDFLLDTYYKNKNEINTKGNQDLVIHTGKSNKSTVSVIIEAKRPSNNNEWFASDNVNRKVLHELILYYLRERIECKNSDIKYLIATNVYEWYIIDASYFERFFYKNQWFVKEYEKWRDGQKVNTKTSVFYEDIAKQFLNNNSETIPCTYFNIKKYEKNLKANTEADNIELISLFKVLSPYHLLKEKLTNDSNALNEGFYKELLYIIGLEEDDKRRINRKSIENRNSGSLIENTISSLEVNDSISKISDVSIYGDSVTDRLFNISLDLVITWINRILFLKLLEGQLINYHIGSQEYRFLNSKFVDDFKGLFKLFHSVLAIEKDKRKPEFQEKYSKVPYLNSSLFDYTKLEKDTIKIDSLDDFESLPLFKTTILNSEKRNKFNPSTLDYLFKFLNAYDFSGEGTDKIQEDRATLVNASVLGKVFEKINGYKDGAIFTPGFITMNMCNTAVKLAITKKFKETFKEWNITSFEDIRNYLVNKRSREDIKLFNEIINRLRICDPAVGSGHFLVSMLNEIIAIKYDLGILSDENGELIGGYEIAVANDELVITDVEGNPFVYQILNGKPSSKKSQNLQKALFHEKEKIIEDCLFGVDINSNSAKICRLRLWIELLKNAYYKESGYVDLETLPNIDINIKEGNSLISRFKLKDDEFKNVPNFKKRISEYTKWVKDYKNSKDRNRKQQLSSNISLFTAEFKKRDPKIVNKEAQLRRLTDEFYERYVEKKLFSTKIDLSEKEKLNLKVEALSKEIEQLKNNPAYVNAFEWRFEFPEVLDEDGEFDGFDIIIGNPPYISAIDLKKGLSVVEYRQLKLDYKVAKGTVDLFIYFFERGVELLKENSFLAYITPNRYLSASYGEAVREFLYHKTEIMEIIDYSHMKVFKEASTYPVVTFLNKVKNLNIYPISIGLYDANKHVINYKLITSQKLNLLEGFLWGYLLNDKILITEKVINQSVPITACGKINATSTASEADLYHGLINEVQGIKLINTGTIDRYKSLWGVQDFTDQKTRYLTPYLNLSSSLISENRRSLYLSTKIILAKIALRTEAFLDDTGAFSSINTNCIHEFSDDYFPKYVLGWLNSKLFQYSFECFFEGLKMQGGYLLYSAPNVSKMYIKAISKNDQMNFVQYVNEIIELKNQNQNSAEVEKALDYLFYKLYNLLPEEIIQIESQIK